MMMSGEMKYVDLAWPWGLVMLSVFAFGLGTAPLYRRILICSCYFFQGLRMGIPAKKIIPKMKTDFPRYEYAKMLMLKSLSAAGELIEDE